jgi:2-keto-4-pentenoate hydratase
MHKLIVPQLSDEQVAAAGDLLIEARAGKVVLGELPQSCRPTTFPDAQRIIDYLHERSGRPAMGWKVFIPYRPMQPPVVAPIYDVLPSGSAIRQAEPPRRIEAEVVFRATADLPARREPYRFEAAAAAVVAMPAFEALQTRYRAAPMLNRWSGERPLREFVFEGMADNNTQGCYVVGQEHENWQEVDFTTMRVTVSQDGRELGSSTGGHPLQNPFLCTFAGINFLRHRAGIAKGQIIATSSFTSFFEVPLAATITASFAGFGEVSASYAA